MADLGKLPNEVMVEILSWLLPESLARFKCVSKSWDALINDPKFGSYVKNQVLLKRQVRIDDETGKVETRFYFLKYPLTTDEDSSVEFEDVHFPWSLHDEFSVPLKIRGHSHGLVCLETSYPNNIFLYNPTTEQLRKLPQSTITSYYSMVRGTGFGYDPISRDFKVVRVMYVSPLIDELTKFLLDLTSDREHKFNNIPQSKVAVYDLKKDKWREIETHLPGHVLASTYMSNMYYQRFYYWLGVSNDAKRSEIILTFDLSKEVFNQILLPKSLNKKDNNYRRIGVLDGSIVLFHYCRPSRVKTRFDIWKMEKSGDGDVISWSKFFKIKSWLDLPRIHNLAPLAFVSSNQLLMETYERQLILLNINTLHFKCIPIEGDHGYVPMVGFIKTFLSLNGMEEDKNIKT